MTPARFRDIVSAVLIIGVTISAVLIVAGFATALLVGWQGSMIGASASTADVTDFASVIDGLAAIRPIALAQLGLLALLLTPILRVVASVAAFALEGDRTYAAISLAVFAILLFSLIAVR